MMLALPLLAAAARALAVAAAASHEGAGKHGDGQHGRDSVPVHDKSSFAQGCDWAALTAGSQPGGEPEPPFARGPVLSIMLRLSVRGNDCAAGRLSVREALPGRGWRRVR